MLDKRFLGLLVVLFFMTTGCKGKEVVGAPAIDFNLEGINGGQITYASLKGKSTILYFFASW